MTQVNVKNMMNVEIIALKKEEQNRFADINTANNGGGYSQPKYEVSFNDGTVIIIDDTSCGDFGKRIYISVEKDGEIWRGKYNSMNSPTIIKNNIPKKFGIYFDAAGLSYYYKYIVE